MDQFEMYRPRLFAIAYRMVGSVSEAEDIVQNAYVRYCQTPLDSITSPKAFLSTVVTRLCLNYLETARVQRESYLGPWLPEPIVTDDDPASPTQQAEMLESISMAFLVLLERLTPVERAVFLLREVFEYPYPEIAVIVAKTEVTCRQIFRRAKKFVAAQRPRFTPSMGQHQQILQRFVASVQEGDLNGLTQVLAADVTLWADGGGKIRGAATRALHGSTDVARFVVASLQFAQGVLAVENTKVNGEPALILRVDGHLLVVISLSVVQQQIREIRVIGNPEKLRHLA